MQRRRPRNNVHHHGAHNPFAWAFESYWSSRGPHSCILSELSSSRLLEPCACKCGENGRSERRHLGVVGVVVVGVVVVVEMQKRGKC
jgi:hypothetical protein